MSCLNCNAETINPKFCSRSCAASYNNKIPKRNKTKTCKKCGTLIITSRTYCPDCWSQTATLDKELNSNQGSNAYVRANARKVYYASERPLSCALCNYSLHVDICHIKDIRSYPQGTPYSVINAESNLIALCKNHHWELDHDML